jgi:hypothetical protein
VRITTLPLTGLSFSFAECLYCSGCLLSSLSSSTTTSVDGCCESGQAIFKLLRGLFCELGLPSCRELSLHAASTLEALVRDQFGAGKLHFMSTVPAASWQHCVQHLHLQYQDAGTFV